ncbi:MAG TPA: hypothetical protein VM328_02820 [Fimbriimonadaceae bacterium]|nr:hypothetical protein [Fimbriimonadaceae bacterium]
MDSRRRVRVVLAIGVCVAAVLVVRYRQDLAVAFAREKADVANYALLYKKPAGWTEKPHSPFTLFLYEHPETKVLLRGAVNNVVADFNPTPELDTNGIAQYNVDTTEQNMPDWTVKRLEPIGAKVGSFSAIWRERNDRTVVTAFFVKGNTTVMITLSGAGGAKSKLPQHMPTFREFVSKLDLEKTNAFIEGAAAAPQSKEPLND